MLRAAAGNTMCGHRTSEERRELNTYNLNEITAVRWLYMQVGTTGRRNKKFTLTLVYEYTMSGRRNIH